MTMHYPFVLTQQGNLTVYYELMEDESTLTRGIVEVDQSSGR